MESRLPATLSASMVLHAAGLGAWLYLGQMARRHPVRVLSNVELMIAVRPAPAPARGAPMQPSTWNFLKMALPAVRAHAPLDVRLSRPEPRPRILPDQLLKENQAKLQKALALEPLKDLGRRRAPMAALEAGAVDARVSRAQLADAPRLEEVGARRASRAAIAMDNALIEAHASGAGPQDISALAAAAPPRPQGPAPMAALSDEAAAPGRTPGSGALDALSRLLPSEPESPHARGGPLPAGGELEAAPAPNQRAAQALAEQKKVPMIEGPLKRRRILHYEIPKFPAWAQAQGVLEAAVRIRFTVAPSGEVLEEMRLIQTSGYGELDRLAMESLKLWRFEPHPEEPGNQWGIITFRFVME